MYTAESTRPLAVQAAIVIDTRTDGNINRARSNAWRLIFTQSLSPLRRHALCKTVPLKHLQSSHRLKRRCRSRAFSRMVALKNYREKNSRRSRNSALPGHLKRIFWQKEKRKTGERERETEERAREREEKGGRKKIIGHGGKSRALRPPSITLKSLLMSKAFFMANAWPPGREKSL